MGPDLDGLRLSLLKEAVSTPSKSPSFTIRRSGRACRSFGRPRLERKTSASSCGGRSARQRGARSSFHKRSGRGCRRILYVRACLYLFQSCSDCRTRRAASPAGMYGWREYAEAESDGYGPNVADILYRAASFVDRIIKATSRRKCGSSSRRGSSSLSISRQRRQWASISADASRPRRRVIE